MASNTYGFTPVDFLTNWALRGWDSRAVTITSLPVNTPKIDVWIENSCGVINGIMRNKGIDHLSITSVLHPQAFEFVKEFVYTHVSDMCVISVSNIGGVDADNARRERDNLLERAESYAYPVFGDAHKATIESRTDATSGQGWDD